MSSIDKRLGALEQRMVPAAAYQVKIVDRLAADWTQEEEDRLCAEAAQYPHDGQVHLVIVERPHART